MKVSFPACPSDPTIYKEDGLMASCDSKGSQQKEVIMRSNKKTKLLPGLRMEPEFAVKVQWAIDKLGLDAPQVRRQLWKDLIDIAERGDQLDLPPRLVRTIPGLRVEPEFALKVQRAIDKLGLNAPDVRRQLWEDLIDIAERGDEIDLPPRLARIMPGLRVEPEFAIKAQWAIDKLGLNAPEVRRQLWEDLIDIAERGDQLASPPRLVRIVRDGSAKT
jgi:hypothetical protein